MGQFISSPHTISTTTNNRFTFSLGYTQGYRLTQEDAHSYTHTSIPFNDHNSEFKTIGVRIFGIYDGHGGKESSNFISKRLPLNLIKEFQKIESEKYHSMESLIRKKIRNSVFQTDLELYDHLSSHTGESSGSTAIVIIIIDEKYLFSVNVGDSRSVLSVNGGVKNLSFDHKPSNLGELIRINESEGMVHFNRVNGILALSRAFGDFDFKKRKINNEIISSSETQVTVEPDIIYHEINSKDEFLSIGCDGIFDVFSNKELIRFIRHNLAIDLNFNEIIDKLLTLGINSADQKTGIGFDNMSLYIVAIQQKNESYEQWCQRIKLKVEIENNLI